MTLSPTSRPHTSSPRAYQPLTREAMARRLALDIPDGSYVNLGIGMPVLVAAHLPDDREIVLHSENGILGMGPPPSDDAINLDLINAGKQPVTLLTGGSYFHHADSFAMMRGGHLDICVMGGMQVAANGDLANWSLAKPGEAPAVGGAMDLAVGARSVFIMMEHNSKNGDPKIVERCTYPLTGAGVVDRVSAVFCVLHYSSHWFLYTIWVPFYMCMCMCMCMCKVMWFLYSIYG